MRTRTTGVLAVIGLLGAGCGSEPAPTTRAERPAARDKAVQFSACMRAHAVEDFPDPGRDGEYEYAVSVSPATFTAAVNACKALKPPGALSSKRSAREQTQSLAFADCVRAEGVRDFPDPVDGQPVINTEEIPSTDSPAGMAVLDAAIAACRGVSGVGR